MIYMNTFEDLADKVRSAADSSDAARIIEDFVTEYGCQIAKKNEFNIANVTSSVLPCSSQKTVDELIDEIKINEGNLHHITVTHKINGSLREEIRHAMSIFAMQEAGEALKLFGIVDPSTQKNEFAIPDVSVNEEVVCDHSGVNVMPRTKWEQTKR